MKKNIKSIINIVVLIAITILILYFSLKDNFNEIINQIFNLNIGWFLVSIFLILGYYFLKALSMHIFLLTFKPKMRFRKTFKINLATQFFNAITPFATGGQPFQIYMLKKNKIPVSNGTNIVIQNFIVYQIALILLGLIAVVSNYFFHFFNEVGLLKSLVTIGFFMNVIVMVGSFIIAFAKKTNKKIVNLGIKLLTKFKIVKNKEKTLHNWDIYINNFHEGASKLLEDKKMFINCILLNFVSLVCLYLIPLTVFYSMGFYDINPIVCILASAYVMLIGSFVPIPGGTGGLEYSFIAFFGNFITGSVLTSAMLIWRFITYYLGMIIGAIAFGIKERND